MGLYKIPVYSGFGLDRFYCIIRNEKNPFLEIWWHMTFLLYIIIYLLSSSKDLYELCEHLWLNCWEHPCPFNNFTELFVCWQLQLGSDEHTLSLDFNGTYNNASNIKSKNSDRTLKWNTQYYNKLEAHMSLYQSPGYSCTTWVQASL